MNEDQMRAVQAIDDYFKSGNSVPVSRATIKREEWEQAKAALASQAKSEPIGYIDREQLARWEKLRGTEFEREERAYIGFSTKPFKTEMTDCTLAVYAAPQPTDDRVRELLESMKNEQYKTQYYDGWNDALDAALKAMKGGVGR